MSHWQERHPGVEVTGLIRGYVAIVEPLAEGVAKLRVHPHAITLVAVVCAVAAAWIARGGAHGWVVLLVLLSALLDGLDGAVASVRLMTSHVGAVLDRIADRISELAFVLIFVAWSAHGWLAAAAWLSTTGLEMGRQRWLNRQRADAARAGRPGPLVPLSIAERPTRVIIVLMFALAGWLVSSAMGQGAAHAMMSGVQPGSLIHIVLQRLAEPATWANVAAGAWFITGLTGIGQVWRQLGRR